jgi:hypothetical protein
LRRRRSRSASENSCGERNTRPSSHNSRIATITTTPIATTATITDVSVR